MHPADVAALRIDEGTRSCSPPSTASSPSRCKISDRVLEGVAFVPLYYDGGAVCGLLGRDGAPVPCR